eukprot:SAG11_NODE_8481_length_1010_cov_1.143798_1_plen_68_part_00
MRQPPRRDSFQLGPQFEVWLQREQGSVERRFWLLRGHGKARGFMGHELVSLNIDCVLDVFITSIARK